MPFRLSLLLAVRSDRLMQQVNKHGVAASHSKRLFIVHLQNFYVFSLTISLFMVRVTFLLLSIVVCLSSLVFGKLKSPFARSKHRFIALKCLVTSCIPVKVTDVSEEVLPSSSDWRTKGVRSSYK